MRKLIVENEEATKNGNWMLYLQIVFDEGKLTKSLSLPLSPNFIKEEHWAL